MSILKGFLSFFSWMEPSLSSKERVEQVLDDFYSDHPWIERDDAKALQKDFEAVANDFKASNLKKSSDLFGVLKILPTDYEEYGGEVKRWADPKKDYPDCSRGCKHFVKLEGGLGYDWGVCSKKGTPRAGLLTWEHQTGVDCYEPE